MCLVQPHPLQLHEHIWQKARVGIAEEQQKRQPQW